jgi:hypothetical protein
MRFGSGTPVKIATKRRWRPCLALLGATLTFEQRY